MANSNYYVGLPGVGTASTATPRDVLLTNEGANYIPVPLILRGAMSRDFGNTGNVDVLRAGTLISKIWDYGGSQNDKYAVTCVGVLTADAPAGSTSLTVAATAATEITRRYGSSGEGEFYLAVHSGADISPDEDVSWSFEAITHSAISGTAITCSATTTGASTGDWLIAKEAVGDAGNAKLTNSFILNEPWGVKVTDDTSTSVDVAIRLALTGGQIDTSKICNYPTDAGLARCIKDALRDGKIGLVFSDEV